MMNVIRLSWLISLAISFFGFLIVNQLFEVQPKGASGNLGFIGFIFLFPFVLLSLFATFRYFLTAARNAKNSVKWLGIISGILLTGFFLYFFLDIKNSIHGSIWKLDQETSRLYFDIYTFGLIHTISGVLGALYGIIKPAALEHARETGQTPPE
ncbi:hypothetical protein [Ureibacillus sp. FSL K6-3587]|uniref:hypothetical protein n=1 Tax=unclassified Ureibacillus TaxID=2638520 RepID=UPI0031582A42